MTLFNTITCRWITYPFNITFIPAIIFVYPLAVYYGPIFNKYRSHLKVRNKKPDHVFIKISENFNKIGGEENYGPKKCCYFDFFFKYFFWPDLKQKNYIIALEVLIQY
ncbi:hypothetical protein BpHYR1_047183 [Brachionus plicatilis]|uniref:Uncharacterized protein n=1 Tax=Brachionus plicatilis TaxID=10195 RepID=A0A3M7S285_BRAPC|nr:hypothetical protein BpHYR1_047183 [Brachionus plicatilis]